MPVAADGVVSGSARSPLALLALRDFRVWWLGFIVSMLAINAHALGVGWLVVELATRHGSTVSVPFLLALVGLARVAPTITLGVVGGVIGDRRDRRNVLVASQGVMGVTALAIWLLLVTGVMSVGALLVLSAVNAGAAAFYHPVRQVIQPRLVGEANLMGALGLNATALSVAALVGPLVGGALVVWKGISGLMLACGVSCIAVAASLATLQPQRVEQRASDSVLRSFVEGLGHARRTPAVLWLLILFAGATLVVRPLPFMLPALARDALHVGPGQLSWLVSAVGGGALLAGLLTILLRRRVVTARLALLIAGGAGLSLVALAAQRSWLAALALVGTTQCLLVVSVSIVVVILQTTTPDGFRGRVMGIQSMLADGGTECGTFVVGVLGGALGISAALGASGAALGLLCLAFAIGVPALGPATRSVAGVGG